MSPHPTGGVSRGPSGARVLTEFDGFDRGARHRRDFDGFDRGPERGPDIDRCLTGGSGGIFDSSRGGWLTGSIMARIVALRV